MVERLAEDSSFVPGTHLVSHNSCNCSSEGPVLSSGFYRLQAFMKLHAQASRQISDSLPPQKSCEKVTRAIPWWKMGIDLWTKASSHSPSLNIVM